MRRNLRRDFGNRRIRPTRVMSLRQVRYGRAFLAAARIQRAFRARRHIVRMRGFIRRTRAALARRR